MRHPKLMLATALAAVLLAALPPEAGACEFLNRLFGCCGPSTQTATYALYPVAPPCAAPAPACATPTCAMPTCAPQTVQYMPAPAYQTYYTPVAVSAYQPVTTIDPCTGCSTVAYRPYTVLTQQAQMVPYASCAPAYSSCETPCASGGCATCPSGVAPATWNYAEPAPGGNATYTEGPSAIAPPASESPYVSPPTTLPSLPPPTQPRSFDPANVRPSLNAPQSSLRYEPSTGASGAYSGGANSIRTPSGSPSTFSAPATSTPSLPLPPARNDTPTGSGTTTPNSDVRPNSLPLPTLTNPNDRQAMRAVRHVSAYEPIVNVGSAMPVPSGSNEIVWGESTH